MFQVNVKMDSHIQYIFMYCIHNLYIMHVLCFIYYICICHFVNKEYRLQINPDTVNYQNICER